MIKALIIFLVMSVSVQAQDSVRLMWKDFVIPRYDIKKGGTVKVGKTNLIGLEVQPNTILTIVVQPAYDTVWTSQVIENNDIKVTKVNTWEGAKAGLSNQNYTAVLTLGTLGSMQTIFTGSEVSFWSERFNSPPNVHGKVTVLIDGVVKATVDQSMNPIGTDFARNQPSFKIKVQQGTHTIKVQSTGQFILDFFSVRSYTLKPR